MTWTRDGITILDSVETAGGLELTVASSGAAAGRVLQCYLSGDLVARQPSPGPLWHVACPRLGPCDNLLLLAVDADEADIDYGSEAAPDSANNRLRVDLPATMTGRRPGQQWRIYVGPSGETPNDSPAYAAAIHPGGYGGGGFGESTSGAFGYDGITCPGWGESFGLGEFGFDCRVLSWRSQPLAPGPYRLDVRLANPGGDELTVLSTVAAVSGPPAAARDLLWQSYDDPSDTLTLGFTPSPDVAARA